MDTRILYIAQIESHHRINSLRSCAFDNEQEAIKYAEEGALNIGGPAYVYKVEYESDAIEDRRGGIIVLDPEAYVEADLIWSTDPQAPNVADADYAFDPYYGPQVYTEALKENVSGEVIYSVNSDLDDGILYAEFETKDAAIEYAKRNLDKLPFIDELHVSRDANGEIDDVFEYKTIWDHTTVDDAAVTEAEEDYWDMMAAQYEEEEKNEYDKYDIGDTTWFESVNSLVETLEENEDIVECKECFELFPKADCTKLEVGYICPTCSCGSHCDEDEVDIILVADEDIFKVDFPEYEKFKDTDDIFADVEKESTEEPVIITNDLPDQDENDSESISTPEEAIPFLVKDEVEAVAGYEKAAEVIEASDLENKEEILDTIDHIKEEEEEHIEELQELVDDKTSEIENETISETDEVEEIEDPEPAVLNEDTTSETKYWKCWYDGNDAAVVEAATEEEAEWTFMDDYKDEYFFDSWDHDWSVEEISKEEYDEWQNSNSLLARHNLSEHVNKECKPIESTQELEGTDNAVVDCKVADVITHSEDEKPVDCEGKKKPLEKPLTEDTGLDHTKLAAWCMRNLGDLYKAIASKASDKEIKAEAKKVSKLIRSKLGTGKETEDILMKGYAIWRKMYWNGANESLTETINYNFTEEEIAEHNMDENGVSLDSYDEYVRCNWCGEVFAVSDCVFEANLGWLCDRCYSAIRSRGEKLTIIKNPTDEDIAKTLTEEVEMTKQELKDKFGTDDVDLINAGREEENRVALKETSSEPTEDIPFEDLPEETRKEIEEITKFVNDAIANKKL